jgi:hypothetical protein
MHDPLAMGSASLKLLLLEKMNAYVSVFSILVSVFELYFVKLEDLDLRDNATLLGTCLTGILVLQVSLTAYF